MYSAKQEVKSLLQKLPNDCTIEDIQYHLYVIEKINKGLSRVKKEGGIAQKDVEKRLGKWLSNWKIRQFNAVNKELGYNLI